MAGRSVKCEIINWTEETLKLDPQGTSLTSGSWDPAPPDECGKRASFGASGDGSSEGQVKYVGPSGSVSFSWNVPASGRNSYIATPGGSYTAGADGEAVGVNAAVGYSVLGPGKRKPAPPAQPTAPDRPEDRSHQSHVPLKAKGPVVISPKRWLVDIAWQAVNHVEWDPMILEITENRHSIVASDGTLSTPCPGQLVDMTKYGVTRTGKCDGADHNTFYSYCGDYVSWVYWKAWVLKDEGKEPMQVTKSVMGQMFNRIGFNRQWVSERNLAMVEAYARDLEIESFAAKPSKTVPKSPPNPDRLLIWHDPKDGFIPQPGDIYLLDRKAGGHIGIIASFKATPNPLERYDEYVTLDGKSFDWRDPAHDDPGWNVMATQAGKDKSSVPVPDDSTAVTNFANMQQGVAATHRRTDRGELVRAYVDASKLRAAMGYR